MSALLELAERLERVTTPNIALDLEIRGVFGHEGRADHLRYTVSLDAAMTLVPEGDAVFWRVGNDGEGGNPGDFKAEILVAGLLASKHTSAVAETPALALCAAALRARAATPSSNTQEIEP